MQGDRVQRAALVVIATIATMAGVSYASSVFAPVAFALFIIALAWPWQKRLRRVLPELVALAVTVAVLLVLMSAFGSLIAWAFGRVGRWIVGDADRFQSLYGQATAWLEGHGVVVAGVWAEHFNVGWMLRALQGITGRLNSTMSFWLIVLVYVVLGLLEVDGFLRRASGIDNREFGRVLIAGSVATAAKIRRYMLVRTQMSLLTGVLVYAFAKLVGLGLAAEWGIIAFALNYIPFIGPFVATMFPTLFAMAQFETWQSVIVVFACLNIIQFVVGSYIEPRVSGNALSISPPIVLFAIFFWASLWGLFGAFIGVPITLAVLTFCAQHPSSRWIAELLGTSAEPTGGLKDR